MKHGYILITSAKNEERSIGGTIESVIAQQIPPLKWTIVDDGSKDSTAAIAERYAREHSFIALIRRTGTAQRDFRSKANAIKEAYARSSDLDFDFIGNIDADISFGPDYFSRLIQHFENNSRLGIGGGIISEKIKGVFRDQRIARNSVAGAVQFFRKECWEEIGGYRPIRNGGTDAVAEFTARMHGWEARTFHELKVLHHRRVGMGEGPILKARFREGGQSYKFGYHPLFQIVKCAYRVIDRPYIAGSIMMFLGYLCAVLRGKPSEVPADVRMFIRNEQIQRFFGSKNSPSASREGR